MTEIDVEGIKARADAATPGPWEAFGKAVAAPIADGRCNCAGGIPESSYVHEPHCGLEPLILDVSLADAEFIAHARQDVPALLDRIAELEAERDAMRPVVENAKTWAACQRLVIRQAELGINQQQRRCRDEVELLAAVDEFETRANEETP